MNKYENIPCPVCGKALKDDSTTAVCPVCATPHHGECYHTLGHCFNEDKHSTGFVWKSPEEVNGPLEEEPYENQGHHCPRCHNRSTSDTLFCPYCGYAFGSHDSKTDEPGGFEPPITPFSPGFIDPLGGVDPTETIDGIAISDMALFIGPGTHKFLPDFLRLSQDKARKTSWNWAAFLFPPYWFAFRKMYKEAVVTTLINLIFTIFSLPVSAIINNLRESLPATIGNYELARELSNKMLADPSFIPPGAMALFVSGLILSLIFRVLCGLFANYIYKNHAVSIINKIRQSDEVEDGEIYIQGLGGINFIAVFVAMTGGFYLTQIISFFLF